MGNIFKMTTVERDCDIILYKPDLYWLEWVKHVGDVTSAVLT